MRGERAGRFPELAPQRQARYPALPGSSHPNPNAHASTDGHALAIGYSNRDADASGHAHSRPDGHAHAGTHADARSRGPDRIGHGGGRAQRGPGLAASQHRAAAPRGPAIAALTETAR